MNLYFSVDPPHRWARFDRKGRFLDADVAAAYADLPIDKGITELVGVVRGDAVTQRRVTVPARARTKALAAAPFALEDGLAADVEELFFALVEWKSGKEALVAVVSREQMDQWQASLAALPRPVDVLLPEYFLLPRHAQAEISLATNEQGKVVIRSGEHEGLTIDETALELWWQSVRDTDPVLATGNDEMARWFIDHGASRVSQWDVGGHFGEWLQTDRQIPTAASLLQGSYEPAHQKDAGVGLRAAAALAAAALLIRVGFDSYDHWRLSSMDRTLDEQIVSTFKEAFPDVTRIVNPRLQMEQRVKSLQGSAAGNGEFQVLLSAVAKAVPGSQAKLEEVNFRDQSLIITCSTQNFAGLDQLKTRFEEDQRVRVELLSSGSRDNRVSGRFRLLLAG